MRFKQLGRVGSISHHLPGQDQNTRETQLSGWKIKELDCAPIRTKWTTCRIGQGGLPLSLVMVPDLMLPLARGVSWVFAVGLSGIALYMLAIAIGSWFYKPRPQQIYRKPRFAVIIPAHDEELGVAATVAQLRSADYPPENIRILVIADNCSDLTAARARGAGAEVWVRHDVVDKGKGQALDWALKKQDSRLADAELIAFVDADMHVHADFFATMAATFAHPATVVAQGRYVISNAGHSFLSAIGFASFCYVNHVRPAGRCFWHGTADLKGGGMVFRSRFLLPRGWPAHSIAEDIQLGKEMMLEGVRVTYVPSAKVESDIPATLAQVKVQQSRWEGGKRSIHISILRQVTAALMRRPTMMLIDGFLDLLVPPLSVIMLCATVGLSLGAWSGSASVWPTLGSIAVFAFAVLSGLLQNRAGPAVYCRLLVAPLFIIWKVALLASLWISAGPSTWQRTPRSPRQDKATR